MFRAVRKQNEEPRDDYSTISAVLPVHLSRKVSVTRCAERVIDNPRCYNVGDFACAPRANALGAQKRERPEPSQGIGVEAGVLVAGRQIAVAAIVSLAGGGNARDLLGFAGGKGL